MIVKSTGPMRPGPEGNINDKIELEWVINISSILKFKNTKSKIIKKKLIH